MTAIDSTDATQPPLIKHAFRLVGNRGEATPYCFCRHCLADDEYSDIELGLDACVTHMLNMPCVIESVTPSSHAAARLSLRVMLELVADARKLLCIQRQTTRALASLNAR